MDDYQRPNRNTGLLYPGMLPRWFRLCTDMKEHFGEIILNEGYRSFKRQQWLYDAPQRGEPLVTRATPGNSLHQYGLAIDIKFAGHDPYSENHQWSDFERLARAHGFETISWERVHIQMRFGLTLAEIQKIHSNYGVSGVWARIDQIRGVEIGIEWLPLPLELTIKGE